MCGELFIIRKNANKSIFWQLTCLSGEIFVFLEFVLCHATNLSHAKRCLLFQSIRGNQAENFYSPETRNFRTKIFRLRFVSSMKSVRTRQKILIRKFTAFFGFKSCASMNAWVVPDALLSSFAPLVAGQNWPTVAAPP